MTTSPKSARPKPPADNSVSAFDETFFDALIVVSFGGPEGPDDVVPFLENVTAGRDVPPGRLQEVAAHYQRFAGVSPINAQNRELIAALGPELAAHGIDLPIYFGNRNWRPMLPDTLREMTGDGIQRALAFVTSAYSSYSGCRQYRENLSAAQDEVGASAPEIVKLRTFYNHPGFVEASAEALTQTLSGIHANERAGTHVAFTAHSIPLAMAESCRYERQLAETATLVAARTGVTDFAVVYQSRSGPPSVPWLEPDVLDHLELVREREIKRVVLAPIGFLSDHMEVMFDLDVEAAETGDRLGLNVRRVPTVGTDPLFVAMIRELVEERLDPAAPRRTLGSHESTRDTCGPSCCLAPTPRPDTRRPPQTEIATEGTNS
jgi:ferrochelatase